MPKTILTVVLVIVLMALLARIACHGLGCRPCCGPVVADARSQVHSLTEVRGRMKKSHRALACRGLIAATLAFGSLPYAHAGWCAECKAQAQS